MKTPTPIEKIREQTASIHSRSCGLVHLTHVEVLRLAEDRLKLAEAMMACIEQSRPRPRGGMGPTDWTPDHLIAGPAFAELKRVLVEVAGEEDK